MKSIQYWPDFACIFGRRIHSSRSLMLWSQKLNSDWSRSTDGGLNKTLVKTDIAIQLYIKHCQSMLPSSSLTDVQWCYIIGTTIVGAIWIISSGISIFRCMQRKDSIFCIASIYNYLDTKHALFINGYMSILHGGLFICWNSTNRKIWVFDLILYIIWMIYY